MVSCMDLTKILFTMLSVKTVDERILFFMDKDVDGTSQGSAGTLPKTSRHVSQGGVDTHSEAMRECTICVMLYKFYYLLHAS